MSIIMLDEVLELITFVILARVGRGNLLTNHGMENVKAFALGLVMEMSAMQKSAIPSITLMTIMMTLMMTLMIMRMMSLQHPS